MLIWDDAKTTVQKLAQNSGSDTVTFLDLMMNAGYKHILQAFGRQVTEQQATTACVADQRAYQVPPDCVRPKTVTLVEGTNRTLLAETPSDKTWEMYRASQQTGRPANWHYRSRFGIGGGLIELNPIPSSANYSIEMIYEASERDLSNAKYVTGSVELTNGSGTVTGTGTTFTRDMVGRYLRPTGASSHRMYYRIGGFTSATVVALENNYHGTTDSGLAYEIVEIFALPEDMHMLPLFYAAWLYWETKGSPRAKEFRKAFQEGMRQAKATHSAVTADITIDNSFYPALFEETYPAHFPTGVSS